MRLSNFLQPKDPVQKHLFGPPPALNLPHHFLHHPRHLLQSLVLVPHGIERQLPRRRYRIRREVFHAPAFRQDARHNDGAMAR